MFVVCSGLAAPKMCAAPRADAGHGGTVGQCHWQRYKILSSKTALPTQQNTKKAAPEVNEYLAQPVKCYFIVTPSVGQRFAAPRGLDRKLPAFGLCEGVTLVSIVADVLSADWAQIATFVECVTWLSRCWHIETNHISNVCAIESYDSTISLHNSYRYYLAFCIIQ